MTDLGGSWVFRISGAMCSLTCNFASARVKCFLAFTQKYLPQFLVSISWKNYEGRSSLKTQLKIEFLLPYTGGTKVLENIPVFGKHSSYKTLILVLSGQHHNNAVNSINTGTMTLVNGAKFE